MKLIPILENIILLEYSEKLVNGLVEKFKQENPRLTDEIIRTYIQDFKNISQKLDNKDITKYNWKDLEQTVDSNRSTKIKAGKIDVTAEDANLLYNKDGLRLYIGNSKKACIKYGNGYSFCISARGEGNLYGTYRRDDMDRIGTPYFLFNDTLPKKDKRHVLVIFHKYDQETKEIEYTVTNAKNDGETEFNDINDMISKFPWIDKVKRFIKSQKLTQYEKEVRKTEDKFDVEQGRILGKIAELKKYIGDNTEYNVTYLDNNTRFLAQEWDNFPELILNAKSEALIKFKFYFGQSISRLFRDKIELHNDECRFDPDKFIDYFKFQHYYLSPDGPAEMVGPFLYSETKYRLDDFAVFVYNDIVDKINKNGGYMKQFLPFNDTEEYIFNNIISNAYYVVPLGQGIKKEYVEGLYTLFTKFPKLVTLYKKLRESFKTEMETYRRLEAIHKDDAY